MIHDYEFLIKKDGIPPYLKNFCALCRYPGFKYEYTHTNYHINILTSGSMNMLCGVEQYKVSAGKAVLFSPGTKYYFESDEGFSFISFNFSDNCEKYELFKKLSSHFDNNISIRNSDASEKDYLILKRKMLDTDPVSQMYAVNIAERLLLELASATESRENSFRMRFLNLISSENPCLLSLETITSKMNYSKPHIERLMKENFGMGCSEYLRKQRISIARNMLRESDLPIYAIAEQTCFYDSAHFIREFKREYGLSPQKYRNEYKEIKLKGEQQ